MTDTAQAAPAAAPAAPAADQQQAPAATDQQQAPAAPAAPTPAELAARQQAAPPAPAAPADQQGPDMSTWPPEAVEAYTRRDKQARDYQREAGDSRIGSKENARKEVLEVIAKALGGGDADQPPTVEAVTSQLTQVQEQANAAQRQAALVQAAWEAKVDPGKLDYLGWKLDKASDFPTLDPAAPDFRAKVSAAVAAQLAADPTLGAAGTVQASGTESHGGASTGSALTKDAWDALPISERTRIFQTDRPTYDRMTGQA